MIIYEVSLAIDETIYAEYTTWLKEHIKDILQLPGFIRALILKEEEPGNHAHLKNLTVQYQLNDRDALEHYFINFAPHMREQALNLFQNKFSIERKIFEVETTLKRSGNV